MRKRFQSCRGRCALGHHGKGLSAIAACGVLLFLAVERARGEGLESCWVEITNDTNTTTSFTSGWWRAGTLLTVTGYPSAGLDFSYWSGDVPLEVYATNPLVLRVEGPLEIQGHSAVDTDHDGFPDAWEDQWGGLIRSPYGDVDGDGAIDLREYHYGTDPANPMSFPPWLIYVDSRAPDGGWGESWADAMNDLWEAMRGMTPGDEVWVAGGVYGLGTNGFFEVGGTPSWFSEAGRVSVYGGFAGIERSRHERNWGANPTVLLGSRATAGLTPADEDKPVLWAGDDVILDGFVIANGAAVPAGAGATNVVAGLRHSGKRLQVDHCLFVGNTARSVPGVQPPAAIVRVGGPDVTFSNCAFIGNQVLPGGNGELLSFTNAPTEVVPVEGCTFAWNDSAEIVSGEPLAPSVRNCVIRDNTGTVPDATYSCVEGGSPGAGNTRLHPGFGGVSAGRWEADAVHDTNLLVTTLRAAGVNWKPGEWVGSVVKPDTNVAWYACIVSNDVDTVTVAGGLWTNALAGADYELFDARLRSGSPCIDRGIRLPGMESGRDLQGEPRVVDGGVEMGAYEYTSGLGLFVRAYLAGSFDTNTLTMSAQLSRDQLIARHTPYADDRRVLNTIPSNAVDLVLLQVTSTNVAGPTLSRSVFLSDSGWLVDDEGRTPVRISLPPDRGYLITVKHRNHLAVQTADPVFFTNESATVDLAADPGTVRGGTSNLLQLAPALWGLVPGDVNGDGQITEVDRRIVADQLGMAGYVPSDANLDGVVTDEDVP